MLEEILIRIFVGEKMKDHTKNGNSHHLAKMCDHQDAGL
jgi:hypothetical protein